MTFPRPLFYLQNEKTKTRKAGGRAHSPLGQGQGRPGGERWRGSPRRVCSQPLPGPHAGRPLSCACAWLRPRRGLRFPSCQGSVPWGARGWCPPAECVGGGSSAPASGTAGKFRCVSVRTRVFLWPKPPPARPFPKVAPFGLLTRHRPRGPRAWRRPFFCPGAVPGDSWEHRGAFHTGPYGQPAGPALRAPLPPCSPVATASLRDDARAVALT